MRCVFDEELQCIYCGWQARVPGTRRMCDRTAERQDAGIFDLVSNYAAALSRWLAAGRPVRTQQEIDGLLEICKACELFDGSKCRRCGCRLSKSTSGWANKLAMATEQCPLGKWGVVESVRQDAVRVGFVLADVRSGGGVFSWFMPLVERLPAFGVSVSGLAFVGGEGQITQHAVDSISRHCPVIGKISHTGAYKVPRHEESIWAIAKNSDVLVVWSLTAQQASACKIASNVPIIGVSHGCSDWWMEGCAKYVDRWVAVSAAAAAPAPGKCDVLANGIDHSRLRCTESRQDVRAAAGLPQDATVAVSIGRISKEKRLELAAAALEHMPGVWLWLVGDGDERERARIKESAGAHADRLVMTPARDDIGNVLAASDCAVLVSQAEGYCLSAVEALAAGVPLASTPVGILPDLDRAIGAPVAEYMPLDPTPQEVAKAIQAAVAERNWQRMAAVKGLIYREHSAEAMAKRWAVYLSGVVAAASSARQLPHPR